MIHFRRKIDDRKLPLKHSRRGTEKYAFQALQAHTGTSGMKNQTSKHYQSHVYQATCVMKVNLGKKNPYLGCNFDLSLKIGSKITKS